jgi:hypothetical protein
MSRTPPSAARAVAIVVGVVALQALLALWFAWPAARTAPRDLPVLVAGPDPAAAAFAQGLRAERPGAFDVRTVPDATAADAALRDRTAYAAFVLGPDGPGLHVASAASPTVAALVTQAAQQIGQGRPVPVTDVVPGPVDDPRGAGFAGGFLPLLLTSIAAGAALVLVVGSRAGRLAGLLAYGLLAGLVAAAVQHGIGVLTGGYLAAAGADALLTLAIAAAVAGLTAVLGRAGMALGAVLLFLVGNPISAVSSAPELLPEPWGAIGQFLPPGAGATLLRSMAFFDGAGGTVPAVVLASWALAGLVLVALRGPRRTAPADPAREAARKLAAAA